MTAATLVSVGFPGMELSADRVRVVSVAAASVARSTRETAADDAPEVDAAPGCVVGDDGLWREDRIATTATKRQTSTTVVTTARRRRVRRRRMCGAA